MKQFIGHKSIHLVEPIEIMSKILDNNLDAIIFKFNTCNIMAEGFRFIYLAFRFS